MSDDVFPDRSMSDIAKIEWMIETNGYGIVPVAPHGDRDPPMAGYSYTVGFTSAFDFPEVVVFGLQPVAASGLLNDIAEMLRDGTPIPVGALFVGLLTGELRSGLFAIEPPQPALFPTLGAWFERTDIDVVQLMWPDRNGWLPWESGFEARLRYAQPIVGHVNLA
jgi:Domain of unknown function (DUF4262)